MDVKNENQHTGSTHGNSPTILHLSDLSMAVFGAAAVLLAATMAEAKGPELGKFYEPGELGYELACSIHELAKTGFHCQEYQELHDLANKHRPKEYWGENYGFENPFLPGELSQGELYPPDDFGGSVKGGDMNQHLLDQIK